MASESGRPFERLSEQDQKAAVDVAVALTVLGTRVPTLRQEFTDDIVTEFAGCFRLSENVVKYAMRELGRNLFAQNWEFKVHKMGQLLTTEFRPIEASEGNGHIIIEP